MPDAIIAAFSNQMSPQHVRARRRYLRLSDEQRAEVRSGFERHRRACERTGCDPDPFWVCEAIDELVNGREDV